MTSTAAAIVAVAAFRIGNERRKQEKSAETNSNLIIQHAMQQEPALLNNLISEFSLGTLAAAWMRLQGR